MNQTILVVVSIIVVGIVLLLILLFTKDPSRKWKQRAKQLVSEYDNAISANDYTMIKTTVVDADKLFDFCLKKKGINGKTMAERLSRAKPYFKSSDYNDIWSAHKVRNRLVHEMDPLPISNLKHSYLSLRKGINVLLG